MFLYTSILVGFDKSVFEGRISYVNCRLRLGDLDVSLVSLVDSSCRCLEVYFLTIKLVES
jgi:hypothetical protein